MINDVIIINNKNKSKNNKIKNDKSKKVDIFMMDKAIRTSQESYCKRLKVGAVFSKDNRALIDGYNGTISGIDNCCEEIQQVDVYKCIGCGYQTDDKIDICKICGNSDIKFSSKMIDKTSEYTVHAEQNVIFYAAKKGIPLDGGTMYITHNPCKQCSKAMVSSGIKKVVFKEFYRDTDGINFLKSCGVDVYQLK